MAETPTKKPVVLAVDDSADLLALMSKVLGADYQILTAEDAAKGLELAAAEPRPDVILLDIEMPGASGFDVIQVLKGDTATAGIPIIFLSGTADPKAEAEAFELGAADYVAKPIKVAVLKARVRTQIALSNRRAELERLVRERTAQLESARTQVIRRLGRAMEFHESAAVGNRVMRLGQYAKVLAQAGGAKPPMYEALLVAAPLHDVGKLGVPAEVLRKPGKLTAPDWERIRRHPELGAEIIGEHDDPVLKLARELALTHHENWDGSGYPKGLKGGAIPWSGRVMAIVDSFESMTATQFHREPRTPDQAAAEIVKGANTRYDPALVEAFKKALPVYKKIRETYADALGNMLNLDFAPGAAKAPAAPTPEPKARPAAPARATVSADKRNR